KDSLSEGTGTQQTDTRNGNEESTPRAGRTQKSRLNHKDRETLTQVLDCQVVMATGSWPASRPTEGSSVRGYSQPQQLNSHCDRASLSGHGPESGGAGDHRPVSVPGLLASGCAWIYGSFNLLPSHKPAISFARTAQKSRITLQCSRIS